MAPTLMVLTLLLMLGTYYAVSLGNDPRTVRDVLIEWHNSRPRHRA